MNNNKTIKTILTISSITLFLLSNNPTLAAERKLTENLITISGANSFQTFQMAKQDLNQFAKLANNQVQRRLNNILPGLQVDGNNSPLSLTLDKEKNTPTSGQIIIHNVSFKGIPLAEGSGAYTINGPSASLQSYRHIPTSVNGQTPNVSKQQATQRAIVSFGETGTLSEPVLEYWVDNNKQGQLSWHFKIQRNNLSNPKGSEFWISAIGGAKILNEKNMIRTAEDGYYLKAPVWEYGAQNNIREKTIFAAKLLFKDANGKEVEGISGPGGTIEDYTWPDGYKPISVSGALKGRYAHVENQDGVSIKFGGPVGQDIFIRADTDALLAQTTAYKFTTRGQVVASVYSNTPEYGELMLPELLVRPNIISNAGCNAYWDGSSINFYAASDRCNNMAQPSIILHELGHGIDHKAGAIIDPAYSEGFGDTLAMLALYGEPCLAPAIYKNSDECLRDAREIHTWPPKKEEMHEAGKIYAAFSWQLYKGLEQKLGNSYKAMSITLYYTLTTTWLNPWDIPSAVWITAFADKYLNPNGVSSEYFDVIKDAADKVKIKISEDVYPENPDQPPVSANPSPPTVEPTPPPTQGGTISIGGNIDEDDLNNTSGGTTSIIQ